MLEQKYEVWISPRISNNGGMYRQRKRKWRGFGGNSQTGRGRRGHKLVAHPPYVPKSLFLFIFYDCGRTTIIYNTTLRYDMHLFSFYIRIFLSFLSEVAKYSSKYGKFISCFWGKIWFSSLDTIFLFLKFLNLIHK